MEIELKKILGDATLASLKQKVLITPFDLDNGDDPKREPGSPKTWKPKLKIDMDDVSKVQYMEEFATKKVNLAGTSKWIKDYWM